MPQRSYWAQVIVGLAFCHTLAGAEVVRFDLRLDHVLLPEFDSNPVLAGPAGSEHVFIASLVISTSGFTSGGVQGWSCALWAAGVELRSISIAGTATAEAAERALQNNAFVKYEVIDPEQNGGKTGVVQAVVLAFRDPVELTRNASHDIGTQEYRARLGERGSTAFLRHEDGLRGIGQPVRNHATVLGSTVIPTLASRRITLGAGAPPETTDCSDGVDNDRNGWTDCADPECRSLSVCAPEACGDGIDNDGDGVTDCLDSDCQGDPACPELCADRVDNDGDSRVDCADPDCDSMPTCRELCTDNIDNDRNGLIDCDDPDCIGALNCQFVQERCGDGIDNDHDGLIDCADSTCAEHPLCRPVEYCSDTVDNDGDELVDCLDPDCAGIPPCPGPEKCRDRLDNDQDGLIDCADPDCALEPRCLDPPEVCDDGADNNADGKIDCADLDCRGHPACPAAEICPDGFDNDSDGQLDCDDSDCAGEFLCDSGGGGFDVVIDSAGSLRLGLLNLLEVDFVRQRSVPVTVSIAPVPGPQRRGVQGWSIAISHDLEFMDFDPDGGLPTTAGTDAARRFASGFEKTEAVDPDRNDRAGFISAVVLSFILPRTLDPTQSQSIARTSYLLKDFAGDGGGGRRSGGTQFADGLRGSGQPVQNALTVDGSTVQPAHFIPLEIQVAESSLFVRGDGNGDHKVNVADAVWIINELVRQGPRVACPRAGDVNADDFYDLADAVFLVHFLFLSGSRPPAPYPECGSPGRTTLLECPLGSVAHCGS